MSLMWTIVPVKDTRHSKQRLASLLEPAERRRLALLMLEDVLDALHVSPAGTALAVVTIDADAARVARDRGARILTDGACDGHTGSVTAAARRLAGEGAEGFLTVPGDVPLVTPGEIATVLNGHQDAPAFSIVPSHDELGSNAVACSPPDAVQLRFGSDSYVPHLAAARRAGLAPVIHRLPGLALDIDTPEDVARLLSLDDLPETRTTRWLVMANVQARLKARERVA